MKRNKSITEPLLPIRDLNFLNDNEMSFFDKSIRFDKIKNDIFTDMILFGESRIVGISDEMVKKIIK